ncbi:hypothetical protein A2716_04265 [candidate division WWE3 bacterium RIFCSPHIGHO2_01_FULL_40_23]|uniref:Fido domain-containing protein n=1 Tax=candidate division WWE3 bacterium RIFCSPLOWO2_01_FULL_41_18 TaxID=1802625 RepID=A0A1F4VD64_UNCKA|nr:MAG: hypothetical protein A2716_04265 [candidate division WWE3 bacterium RIFCSPHIGHO2_01_FULL_40_23]OGC55089.1 MAG: hypothetical protein A3A78_03875 [candidate division WWE3 bacterium RIFCSPLOWO2_01_FULL_41_18]
MSRIRFLTLEEILFLHELSLELYGGADGIRALALLESSVQRPKSSFGGKFLYQSIFDKASSLIHSLILNHPFVDGNKRTAVYSVFIFLHLNGWEIRARDNKFYDLVTDIIKKRSAIKETSNWLKINSVKI